MSEPPDPDGPPGQDVPPWAAPGAVRRDCEPHRGGLLHLLGTIALLTGAFSLLCVPFGFVGLPLGIFVWCCARRDLTEIRAGTMEPAGEKLTTEALAFAQCATVGALFALVIWGYILSVAL